MNKNLERFTRRSERVEVNGAVFVAKELATAADLTNLDGKPLKMLIACIYEEDGVTPAFTTADIDDMENSSMRLMSQLVAAVNRVNGLDRETEVKNSEAAPTGG